MHVVSYLLLFCIGKTSHGNNKRIHCLSFKPGCRNPKRGCHQARQIGWPQYNKVMWLHPMRGLCVFLFFCIFYTLFGAVVLQSVTSPFFFTCRLRNIRYTFNTILVVALWRVLIARSQIARNLWQFILALVLKFVRFSRLTGTIRQ